MEQSEELPKDEHLPEKEEQKVKPPHKKKKKKNRPKKKLINMYWSYLNKKAERGQPLHPVEQCFIENRWIQIYRKEDRVLIFRLLQQHFREKENSMYKSKRDVSELPHDFSSTKGAPTKISKINKKYYDKRYYLFSRYDEGIELDEEMTPEEIAAYIAKKCKCSCILDAFCGAGGNAIQFAYHSENVYANDIDPKKLSMALNNAQIYKIQQKITYLNKDFLKLDKTVDFKVEPAVVFVSPPWGGVNYSKEEVYDLGLIKPAFDDIVKKSLELADNLVLFLPRNVDLDQLADILLSYSKLFERQNKECIVTIEALIYGGHNIKALLVQIGPMFHPKTQELIPRIKTLFKTPFEAYESIIVQNIMKGRSFAECYEMALEMHEKNATPKEYIGKLRELFTEEEWNVVKKLHKKPGGMPVAEAKEEEATKGITGKRSSPEEPLEEIKEEENEEI